jgi:hypothetical protein
MCHLPIFRVLLAYGFTCLVEVYRFNVIYHSPAHLWSQSKETGHPPSQQRMSGGCGLAWEA